MIHLQGIFKQYGSKVLFENAQANLGHRSRVALVGPNGAGKSTLIRILLGLESPDSGQVGRAKHLMIGHLAQEVPKFSGRTVLQEVMRLDGRREDLLDAKIELEQALEKDPTDEEVLERYGRVLEELEHLDEYRLESRAQQILSGVGFQEKDYDRNLTELSGGWLMRVALARILLMDPDLLLLDEPTNHLDLESLLWLEEFLKGFRGSLLLVSHDTAFLNRLVSEVWEIDQKRLQVYRGNIDSFVSQKQERLAVLKAQYEGQQAKVAEIEKFVARFGAKSSKARQAQSRLKQLEKMDLIELPEDRSSIRFRFPPAPHSGKEVVTIKNGGLCFGEKVVFQNLNWVIQRGSRVAIVGVNGAGKTSLLRLLSQRLMPTQGEVKFGHAVEVGYYAQIQAESLQLNRSILQELEAVAPDMPVSRVRAIAGAFLFTGDAVEKKCAVLSGGEKARVALAKLLLSPSNFLILDEPTNHLDVESRGVLLEALEDYEGTLCLVSHDREFMGPLVDTVLEVIPHSDPHKGSEVAFLVGSYEDYLERKLREASSRLSEAQESKKNPKERLNPELSQVKKGPSNNQIRNWERERDALEEEISRLEKRQSDLHLLLGDEQTYQDKEFSLQLMEEQRVLAQTLIEKMSRWEELCGLII